MNHQGLADMELHMALSFGEWLKAARRAHDLTQYELARRIGCAEITIRKIEANQLRPSKRLLHLLLRELKVVPAQHEPLVQLARRR